MKKIILLVTIPLILSIVSLSPLKAQNIGVGTTTPNANALLHVDLQTSATKGLLVTGIYNAGSTIPDLGPGNRMMFYPGKAAFRVGGTAGTQWNNVNVGNYSTAMGFSTTASGFYSTAMGYNANASGIYSTAMGSFTTARGPTSTAMGYNTDALGEYATSMGISTFASGDYSTSMGHRTFATGNYSTAMGNQVSTSGFEGAFAIGDNSTTTIMESFVANGFRARFAGGYRLLTNSAATIGVVLLASGNSWSAISDENLKENFIPVDGESFLNNIANMPLTTWNYKGQDAKTWRHYGPMAQDFYKAFGKDELGEIGCDTLINQHDFLGVNLIAIQALEKRSATLNADNEKLKMKNEELENKVADLNTRLEKLEKLLVFK